MRLLYIIKSFLFHLKRSFQLWKMGWKDNDWDYDYLLELEEQKLKWMQKYFKNSKFTENDELIFRRISLTLNILNIIRYRDCAIDLIDPDCEIGNAEFKQTKYINTKNWKNFLPECSTFNKNIDRPDSIGCICRDTLRVEKAWHLYNKIREQWMRSWWD